MAIHVFVRFDATAEHQQRLRDEVQEILEPTRRERGCTAIHFYESTRDPRSLFIHSEWTDEAAFEAHADLPHMKRFLAVVGGLIAHPFEAVRTKRVD